MNQQILGADTLSEQDITIQNITITAQRNGNNIELIVGGAAEPTLNGTYYSAPASNILSVTIRGSDDDAETININGELWTAAEKNAASRSIVVDSRGGLGTDTVISDVPYDLVFDLEHQTLGNDTVGDLITVNVQRSGDNLEIVVADAADPLLDGAYLSAEANMVQSLAIRGSNQDGETIKIIGDLWTAAENPTGDRVVTVELRGGGTGQRLTIDDSAETTAASYHVYNTYVHRNPSDAGWSETSILYSDVDELHIDAGSASDGFYVNSTNSATDTVLDGANGFDTFVIGGVDRTLNGIDGDVTVNGDAGNDELRIVDLDTNPAGAQMVYTITNSTVSRDFLDVDYNSIHQLTLQPRRTNNLISIHSTHEDTAVTTLDVRAGGGGSIIVGNGQQRVDDIRGYFIIDASTGVQFDLTVDDRGNPVRRNWDSFRSTEHTHVIQRQANPNIQGDPEILIRYNWGSAAPSNSIHILQAQNAQAGALPGNGLHFASAEPGEFVTVETGNYDDTITFDLGNPLPVDAQVVIEGAQGDDLVFIAQGLIATDQVQLIDTEDLEVDGDGFSLGGLTAAGTFTVAGDYVQNSGGKLYLELGDYSTGDFDQLVVNGTVTLAGELVLNTLPGFSGSSFVLIDNTGTTSVIGVFDNLTEGTLIALGGTYYEISYAGGDGNDVTLTATGSTGNDPPEAYDDFYDIRHDEQLTVSAGGVLDNDEDPEEDTLTAVLVSGPLHAASFTLYSDGSFSYTPTAGFAGSDEFVYKANDGANDSNVAAVHLDVTNEAPIAVDDQYNVLHDRTLTSSDPEWGYGVLDNDWDDDGDPMTASLISGPAHAASFALNADGSFVYTPENGYVGADSFTYRAFDGIDYSDEVTVSIDVTNQAPVAVDDFLETNQDEPLVIDLDNDLLFNDYDDDEDDELTITHINGIDVTEIGVGETITLSNGELKKNADGTFTYTPALGFFGTDSLTYEISDGITSSLATVYIEVYENI